MVVEKFSASFAKLRMVTVSFVMFVRIEQLVSPWTDFYEICFWVLFWKICRENPSFNKIGQE